MKNKLTIFALALLAVLCLAGFTLQPQKTTWEYKQIMLKLDNKTDPTLADLGGQGWELVNANDLQVGGSTAPMLHCYFKRPK